MADMMEAMDLKMGVDCSLNFTLPEDQVDEFDDPDLERAKNKTMSDAMRDLGFEQDETEDFQSKVPELPGNADD